MNVRDALGEAARRIAARDAEVLLGRVLGQDRAWLIAHSTDEISGETHAALEQLVRRRASGEPLQYVVGEQEFFGLRLRVTPAVLIPRPETEILVERVV